MQSIRVLLRTGFCAIILPFAMEAQVGRAGIFGTVTDSSGGAVANVNVQAVNTATNVATATVTNETGYYALPYLPVALIA